MSDIKDNYRERLCRGLENIESYSAPEVICEIKLDGNESPFELNPEIRDEILEKIPSLNLNRYPSSGAVSLKKAVSSRYNVPEDNILFGNGSDELIQILIEVFTGKSSTVLVPQPTFSMYALSSLVLGKKVVEVNLDHNFDINLDFTLKCIEQYDPDITFFSTPNNPTGNSFSREKILTVLNSTSGLILVDEAYFDYHGETFLPLLSKFDNLVVMRTMSKVGFASIRLGMLFANAHLIHELSKARLPYNVNSITQLVAEVAIDKYELLESSFSEIKIERDLLYENLKRVPNIDVFPSDANFLLIQVSDADLYFSKLLERGILVRNFNGAPCLDNCIRVTVGTSLENARFLDALSSISSF